jgi:hypothetical protein
MQQNQPVLTEKQRGGANFILGEDEAVLNEENGSSDKSRIAHDYRSPMKAEEERMITREGNFESKC